MTENLEIRPAVAGDMKTIIGLIDEARAWLPTRGTDQWARPWPTEAARDARVRRGLRERNTWMVMDDGAAIATVTSRKYGNQKLWTAGEQREPAVYVSRLIVSRAYSGNQIGSGLLDWAGYRALQSWQAQWIRIDVWTTNLALHEYYEKRGFRHVRICEFDDPDSYPSAALFQKPTTEIDERAVARFIGPADTSLTPGGTSPPARR